MTVEKTPVQANELRIGNWVLYANSITPTQIDPYSFAHITDYMEAYEPIPLTPEILEKCGFEIHYLGYHERDLRNGNKLGIWLDDAIWVFNEATTAYQEITLIKPSYLHQLQNLYFALTNSELTINL